MQEISQGAEYRGYYSTGRKAVTGVGPNLAQTLLPLTPHNAIEEILPYTASECNTLYMLHLITPRYNTHYLSTTRSALAAYTTSRSCKVM